MKNIREAMNTRITPKLSDAWLVIPIVILWMNYMNEFAFTRYYYGIGGAFELSAFIAIPAFALLALRVAITPVADGSRTRFARNSAFAALWISTVIFPFFATIVMKFLSSPSLSFFGMIEDTGIREYEMSIQACIIIGFVSLAVIFSTQKRAKSTNIVPSGIVGTSSAHAAPPESKIAWVTRFVGMPIVIGWIVYGVILTLMIPNVGWTSQNESELLAGHLSTEGKILLGLSIAVAVIVGAGLLAIAVRRLALHYSGIKQESASPRLQASAIVCWILNSVAPTILLWDFIYGNHLEGIPFSSVLVFLMIGSAITQITTVYGMAFARQTDQSVKIFV